MAAELPDRAAAAHSPIGIASTSTFVTAAHGSPAKSHVSSGTEPDYPLSVPASCDPFLPDPDASEFDGVKPSVALHSARLCTAAEKTFPRKLCVSTEEGLRSTRPCLLIQSLGKSDFGDGIACCEKITQGKDSISCALDIGTACPLIQWRRRTLCVVGTCL